PAAAAPAVAPPLTLARNVWGELVWTSPQGETQVGVSAIRMFPISDPNRWIALCDPQGRELTTIDDLAALPPATRLLVEEELGLRGFIPVIRRVYHISSLSEPCEWDVETDRGRTSFVLRSEEDVRRLTPHRAIIVDARGIRFLLSDVRELDQTSRRFVEWYL
ncbi:MAG: DUF1854 domain-containing protein, partial [Planctomycetota bacterium]